MAYDEIKSLLKAWVTVWEEVFAKICEKSGK